MNMPTVRVPGLARAFAFGALSPLLLSAVLHAQAVTEPEAPASGTPAGADKDLVVLEKFEVTGSRIKRVDTESVSPVVQLHQGDLRSSGFPTLADSLRSLSYNSGQAITTTDAGANFAPGVSTMNLRGLGNNQTLVLINGRRAAPYAAPAFNGYQTVFDLNSIPDEAIESVEILKDGGSAIYGSDAVAGVVNFKMRRDYDGGQVKVEVGDYSGTGGFRRKGTVTYGTTAGKTSMLAVFDWQLQDPISARNVRWARSANKEADAAKTNPRYRGTGWADVSVPGVTTFKSEAEYVAYISTLNGFTSDPVADSRAGWGWFDARSSRGYPGYVVASDGSYNTYDAPTDNPTLATLSQTVGYNPYDYQQTNGFTSREQRYSFFSTFRHEFSKTLYLFSDVSFTRVETDVVSASTPVDLENEYLAADNDGSPRLTDAGNMIIPSFSPYNPFGEDLSSGRRRLVETGNRTIDVTSDTPRMVLGLGGDVAGFEKWTWESAALYSKNHVRERSLVVTDDRMQEALLGLTRAGDGSLSWNPATPQAQRVYFNWFGTNEPAFADFLESVNPTAAKIEYFSLDLNTGGTLWTLPGGDMGLSLGAERRWEKFANERTVLNATSNIVSGDSGASSKGDRNVTSLYGELNIPVIKQVEVQIAGRFEDYSDKDFAQSVRPKFGLKYHPVDWLVLRGSYSKSFKAPDLAYLYTSSQTTFTGTSVWDPLTHKQIAEMQIVTAGNLNLRPELTDSWYAGMVFEPKGFLKNLQVSVDAFRYEQKNLLAQPSEYMGYSAFLLDASRTDSPFYGRVVRDTPAAGETYGDVLYIRDDYANLSEGITQGLDLGISYQWPTTAIGDILLGATATWYDKVEVDGVEYVGTRLNARWNATASVGWRRGNWEANVYGVLRGARKGTIDLGSAFGPSDFPDGDYVEQPDDFFVEYDIKPQFTLNTSVSYKGFRKLTVTVGVNNLLNSVPPLDPQEVTGTTSGVNDPAPAFWYVSLSREF
jgi:iron complex outermembrane recepter protein